MNITTGQVQVQDDIDLSTAMVERINQPRSRRTSLSTFSFSLSRFQSNARSSYFVDEKMDDETKGFLTGIIHNS